MRPPSDSSGRRRDRPPTGTHCACPGPRPAGHTEEPEACVTQGGRAGSTNYGPETLGPPPFSQHTRLLRSCCHPNFLRACSAWLYLIKSPPLALLCLVFLLWAPDSYATDASAPAPYAPPPLPDKRTTNWWLTTALGARVHFQAVGRALRRLETEVSISRYSATRLQAPEVLWINPEEPPLAMPAEGEPQWGNT